MLLKLPFATIKLHFAFPRTLAVLVQFVALTQCFRIRYSWQTLAPWCNCFQNSNAHYVYVRHSGLMLSLLFILWSLPHLLCPWWSLSSQYQMSSRRVGVLPSNQRICPKASLPVIRCISFQFQIAIFSLVSAPLKWFLLRCYWSFRQGACWWLLPAFVRKRNRLSGWFGLLAPPRKFFNWIHVLILMLLKCYWFLVGFAAPFPQIT